MIHNALNTTPFSEELKSPGTEREQNELSHEERHLTKQHFPPHRCWIKESVFNIWYKLKAQFTGITSWAENTAKQNIFCKNVQYVTTV